MRRLRQVVQTVFVSLLEHSEGTCDAFRSTVGHFTAAAAAAAPEGAQSSARSSSAA